MLQRIMKGQIMEYFEHALIIEHARERRAQEMRRCHGLFASQMRLYGQLLVESLSVMLDRLSEALRPLFSWNPRPY